jgi:hypothetical protein
VIEEPPFIEGSDIGKYNGRCSSMLADSTAQNLLSLLILLLQLLYFVRADLQASCGSSVFCTPHEQQQIPLVFAELFTSELPNLVRQSAIQEFNTFLLDRKSSPGVLVRIIRERADDDQYLLSLVSKRHMAKMNSSTMLWSCQLDFEK